MCCCCLGPDLAMRTGTMACPTGAAKFVCKHPLIHIAIVCSLGLGRDLKDEK